MGEERTGTRRWAARYSVGLTAAITTLTAQACGGSVSHNPSGDAGGTIGEMAGTTGHAAEAASGGTSGSGTTSGATAGTLSIGGIYDAGGSSGINPDCAAPTAELFAEQALKTLGAQRIFYSWTTDEQVAELRNGGDLFSRSERPGLGRGLVFDELDAFAKLGIPESKLAGLLSASTFAKARFAWTNPWATVLGMPGESYGNQLLEIELKPEAWIVLFNGKSLNVRDMMGSPVSTEQALATPERIGAIFHLASPTADTVHCGSFMRSLVGFREFVLGNLQMVKQWSLATDEIRQRLISDIGELSQLRQQLACLGQPDSGMWSQTLSCDWAREYSGSGTLGNYENALSLANEQYYPSDANLESLLAALKMSLPMGAPLTVTPGK